jgi:hypothetical protein
MIRVSDDYLNDIWDGELIHPFEADLHMNLDSMTDSFDNTPIFNRDFF